jgi:acetolactate synthase-1/2/3 large subunit
MPLPNVPASATTTGARLVVDALLTHGVERVFCVPGESFLAVLDSLHDETERIETVVCRHEAAAAIWPKRSAS